MAALAMLPLLAGIGLGMYTMYRSRQIPNLTNDPEESRHYLYVPDMRTFLNAYSRHLELVKNLNTDVMVFYPFRPEKKKTELKIGTYHLN